MAAYGVRAYDSFGIFTELRETVCRDRTPTAVTNKPRECGWIRRIRIPFCCFLSVSVARLGPRPGETSQFPKFSEEPSFGRTGATSLAC